MSLPPTALLSQRHERLRDALREQELDALIVRNASNIRYLSSHAGSAGVLVVTARAIHLIVDFRYEEAVRALQASPSACPGLKTWPVPNSYEQALWGCLVDIGAARIGFEAAHTTVAQHAWLERTAHGATPSVAFAPTERLVEQLRIVKDAAEIGLLRDAAARLTGVADAAFRVVRPGVSESQVAGVIETALRAAGYERPAFETIVASGPNAARPHHRAGTRLLRPGDLVVLDFGGVLDGYCCDLTRTVAVGPPSDESRRVYDAVRDAQQAAIAAVRPGIAASEVDAAARNLLGDRRLGDVFGHGTGHGLGLDVHEEPRVGKPRPDAPAAVLAPGMVITIEPGAYLAGWGGVRIEDDVLVTEAGCEVLTSVPKELLVL